MAVTRRGLVDALASAGAEGRTARGLVRDLGGPRGDIRAVRSMLAGLVRSGVVERRAGRYVLAAERRRGAPPRPPPRGRTRSAPGGAARRRGRREEPPGRRRPARTSARRGGPEPETQGRAPAGRARRGRSRGAPASGASGERIGIVVPGRRGGVIRPYPDDGSFVVHGTGGHPPATVLTVAPAGPRGLEPGTVLGRAGDADADFAAIVLAHALPTGFPEACEAEARRAGARVPEREARRRVDLRELPLATIDPASARDHDDAVAAFRLPGGGHRLLVAIADVAHFVPEGSALDREARERGNSVYFPDRAIPMLPERLASDLCSLRPGEDRLAMAVELRFDAEGAVQRTSVYPARLRSHARLVYEEAAAAMAGEAPLRDAALQASLEALAELSGRLTRRRLAEGSLDLEIPETRIRLGPDGRPEDAGPSPRTRAHRAVEESMLAANRAVASLLGAARQPALYRVHEAPDPEDLEAVADAVAGFGASGRRAARLLEEGRVNRALRLFEGAPEARGVHLLLLRAMKQARYAPRDTGHYALAFDAYTHFTSPIRRYADLVVHRAVKAQLRGERRRGAGLAPLATHLSQRERAAMAAERQMHALKAAVLMEGRRGQVAEGLVSGLIPQGVFVTLLESGLDGYLPARELGQGARFDERRRVLSTRRPRRRIRLGDRLRVAIASADLARGRVRLELVEMPQPSPRASSSAARRSHSR